MSKEKFRETKKYNITKEYIIKEIEKEYIVQEIEFLNITNTEMVTGILYRNEFGQKDREIGPAVEFKSGLKFWYKNDKFHREGGPAFEGKNHVQYYINGNLHREDGPADICYDGGSFYFLNGIGFNTKEDWEEAKLNGTCKCDICLNGQSVWWFNMNNE